MNTPQSNTNNSPTLTSIELNAENNTIRLWDWVDRLRNLRRTLDGSSAILEEDTKMSEPPQGIIDRIDKHLDSSASALNDLLREIEYLEALVGNK